MRAETLGRLKPCTTDNYLHILCAHGRLHPRASVGVHLLDDTEIMPFEGEMLLPWTTKPMQAPSDEYLHEPQHATGDAAAAAAADNGGGAGLALPAPPVLGGLIPPSSATGPLPGDVIKVAGAGCGTRQLFHYSQQQISALPKMDFTVPGRILALLGAGADSRSNSSGGSGGGGSGGGDGNGSVAAGAVKVKHEGDSVEPAAEKQPAPVALDDPQLAPLLEVVEQYAAVQDRTVAAGHLKHTLQAQAAAQARSLVDRACQRLMSERSSTAPIDSSSLIRGLDSERGSRLRKLLQLCVRSLLEMQFLGCALRVPGVVAGAAQATGVPADGVEGEGMGEAASSSSSNGSGVGDGSSTATTAGSVQYRQLSTHVLQFTAASMLEGTVAQMRSLLADNNPTCVAISPRPLSSCLGSASI
eukprot:COSAG05_NODE_116_length_17986_cov_348.987534_5_plen_415_part_00